MRIDAQKGFRHVLQDEPDAVFVLQPSFISGLDTLAKHNYQISGVTH